MSVIADSRLSYGGDDRLPAFQMTWLGRIANTASAIGMESSSTCLSSVRLYSVCLPCRTRTSRCVDAALLCSHPCPEGSDRQLCLLPISGSAFKPPTECALAFI
ncbi:hypothetical protein B0H14DRAFT_3856776 [Mycena olivaceomarginata]|nr:hypothetical protein B0H14DRAFT_3856776 [Mycena olivaceomarginata]